MPLRPATPTNTTTHIQDKHKPPPNSLASWQFPKRPLYRQTHIFFTSVVLHRSFATPMPHFLDQEVRHPHYKQIYLILRLLREIRFIGTISIGMLLANILNRRSWCCLWPIPSCCGLELEQTRSDPLQRLFTSCPNLRSFDVVANAFVVQDTCHLHPIHCTWNYRTRRDLLSLIEPKHILRRKSARPFPIQTHL